MELIKAQVNRGPLKQFCAKAWHTTGLTAFMSCNPFDVCVCARVRAPCQKGSHVGVLVLYDADQKGVLFLWDSPRCVCEHAWHGCRLTDRRRRFLRETKAEQLFGSQRHDGHSRRDAAFEES